MDEHWDENYIKATKKQIIDMVGVDPRQMQPLPANLNIDA
jgi:hypothetical protein